MWSLQFVHNCPRSTCHTILQVWLSSRGGRSSTNYDTARLSGLPSISTFGLYVPNDKKDPLPASNAPDTPIVTASQKVYPFFTAGSVTSRLTLALFSCPTIAIFPALSLSP